MRLDRKRLLILVAAVGGAALTARLGVWQLDRADQKIELHRLLVSRHALPPLSATELARDEERVAAQIDRRVVVEGRWLPKLTIYLDNRAMDDRAGFYAVTPLGLADGSAVLVERGWVARDPEDRTHIVVRPLPSGTVTVEGRIAAHPQRLFAFSSAERGPIRQNLDVAAYARETKLELRPLVIVQEGGTASDGLLRDWPLPAANVQMHYGYAFQWFSMSVLIAVLYVWFQLIRPRRVARG
jgi:surfeit locus 1 family protein